MSSVQRRPAAPAFGDTGYAADDTELTALADGSDTVPVPRVGDTLILRAIADPATAVRPSRPAPEPEPGSCRYTGSRHVMQIEGGLAPVDERLAASGYGYERYTRMAGRSSRWCSWSWTSGSSTG
jgi:hypothetical protein